MTMPYFQFDDGFSEPNPLVQTMQHLLPPAAVGLGAGIMNILAGGLQNQRREELEKVMLVAKYKADESLQTRQHQHDRTLQTDRQEHDRSLQWNQHQHDRSLSQDRDQYNAAVQITLSYLAHEQQLEVQGKQHQHDRSMQRSEHGHQDEMQLRDLAHREVMYRREAEERLALHYLSQQFQKESAIQAYELGKNSHEYQMARQLFPHLSITGLKDKCQELIEKGLPNPVYLIPSNFKIPNYYGLDLFDSQDPQAEIKFSRFVSQLDSQRLKLIRDYVTQYNAGGNHRPALLLSGVWPDTCSDEAAHLNLHALGRGVVPMIASEVKVNGDDLVLLVSYVGVKDSFCTPIFHVPFRELLRNLAVNEALRWDQRRQQLLMSNRSSEDIAGTGGTNEYNRQLWEQEQADLNSNRHLGSDDYPYYLGDLGAPAGTLIAAFELIFQFLLLDLHHLGYSLDVQQAKLVTPRLPALLPGLFHQLTAGGANSLIRRITAMLVEYYIAALTQLKLQVFAPELMLEIAQELVGIDDNHITQSLGNYAVQVLADQRQLNQRVSLTDIKPLETVLYQADRPLIDRINTCLESLNLPERLNIITAYFNRGVSYLQSHNFTEAVSELDVVMNLNPHVEAYFQRSFAHLGLKNYPAALEDLEQVALLQPHRAEVFELRGDILHQRAKGKDIEQAIAFYNQAMHLGSTTAQSKRDRLQAWWHNEGRRKKAQKFYQDALQHFEQGNYEQALTGFQQAEQYGHSEARQKAQEVRSEQERRKNLIYKLPNGGGDLEFVWVPGGVLKMEGGHEVTLKEFRISKYPITQRQYFAIMKTNPSHFTADLVQSEEKKPIDSGNKIDRPVESGKISKFDRPVEQVTWDQAGEFCTKLSGQDYMGKQKVSLPSETQWEWAARGATLSKGYTYTGSNNLDEVGWHGGSSGMSKGKTHPVGQLQGNELEIHDMSGNVWEWCMDNWASSSNILPTDGTPLTNGGDSSYRALRGGSWNDNSSGCTSANRCYDLPDYRHYYYGFRVVLF